MLLFAGTVIFSHRSLLLASMLVFVIWIVGGMVAHFAAEPVGEVVQNYQDIFTNPIRFFANLSLMTTFIAFVVTAVICGAAVLASTIRGKRRRCSELIGNCSKDASFPKCDRD